MPTEMFLHFFKSLSDAARMNLNVKAEGQNEHHKIEGIFKALARALKMAVKGIFITLTAKLERSVVESYRQLLQSYCIPFAEPLQMYCRATADVLQSFAVVYL